MRLSLVVVALLAGTAPAGAAGAPARPVWDQWRGPTRDGLVGGPRWPAGLGGPSLERLWRVPLGPSYSGPVVAGGLVYTTETKDRRSEVVTALDRRTGKPVWRAEWQGAMTVPFFARSNGDWIRATPAFDGESLYVAGMRDVLVCLDARTGKERWRVDFVERFKAPLPTFGFVSSPLVDGEAVYVQAGGAAVRLDRKTGKVAWRALEDGGGMMGSAFSSPVLADLAGRRQLLVQTRVKLAGLDPAGGSVLWEQPVPHFRGMNILTPTVVGDAVFTSGYSKGSWLFKVSASGKGCRVEQAWENKVQGYMTSPVVIGGHAYLHLQNQRFACVDLATGKPTWTSPAYGKYASLVAQGDRILALDQRGVLLLIRANPARFELLDQRQVSDQETWAHLAVCGDELYIRELNALSAYRWRTPAK